MEEKKKKFFTKEVKYRSGDVETVPNTANIIKFGVGAILFIILILVLWPFKVIGPTERGVVKTFGEVQERILEPGLRIKAPIAQSITTYDLTPTKANVNIPISDKDDTKAAITVEQQPVGVEGFYAWIYDETKILDIARNYSSLSRLRELVDSEILSAIRQTIGRYPIVNLIPDQERISQEARDQALRNLTIARIPVLITQLQLNNWDWSADYQEMIQQTMTMKQNAQKAEAELRMIEQTTQQDRIRAEATAAANIAAAEGRLRAAELDAQATVAKANGERDAAIATAEGRNRANALIAQNMQTEIRLRELEIALTEAGRWNGRRVPDYVPLNPAGGIVTLPGR